MYSTNWCFFATYPYEPSFQDKSSSVCESSTMNLQWDLMPTASVKSAQFGPFIIVQLGKLLSAGDGRRLDVRPR